MAVTNDLATDQRVDRHCRTLVEAGYRVLLIGRKMEGSPQVERPYPTERMQLRHHRGWRFYAKYNHRLYLRLIQIQPDVVWANDTDTLLGCWLAARRLRCKLVMDAHELFPEVPELQHKPIVKCIWTTLERWLMPRCDARLTVCQSLADYYYRKYRVEMAVVRNLPSENIYVKDETTDAIPDSPLSFHLSPFTLLYQGAVNLGRGVDWAIDALEWLPKCRLVVAGDGDLMEQMQEYAQHKPWHDRIEFTGRLEPTKLARLTRQASVGLVMLEDLGLSYHYALPNRIGDFIAAGVPIVVSDLPEMADIVRRYHVGEVMHTSGPRALAESVEKLLGQQWTDADFAEARRHMDWNNEKKKLTECVNVLMHEREEIGTSNTNALTN